MPKQNISPSTRFFPYKEHYEIFDGKIFAVEKFKIFVQDFVSIRPCLKAAVNTVWILSKSCMFFGCFGSQKTLISCLRAGFVFFYEDIPGAISF